MSGLLGFLIASTILASIGTAIRGLLRPLSWALLGVAVSLLISNRILGIPGSQTEEIANQTTPSPPISPSDRPLAQEGWQDVARELEDIYSDTLADAQAPRGSDENSLSENSSDETSSASNGNVNGSDDSFNESAVRDNSRQIPAPVTSSPSSSPIPGFW